MAERLRDLVELYKSGAGTVSFPQSFAMQPAARWAEIAPLLST